MVSLVTTALSSLACGWVAALAQSPARTELTLDAAPVWFEEFGASASISPDGRWAVYHGSPLRLYDLGTHRETREPIWPGLDVVRSVAFGANGDVFLRGRVAGRPGWFRRGASAPVLVPLPADADPQWSSDGSRVAYFRARSSDSGVVAGSLDHPRAFPLPGAVTGLAWMPSRDTVVVVTMDTAGVSALYKIDVIGGQVTKIAGDLDAVPGIGSPIAVTPDGGRAFIALAGDRKPVALDRQRPNAARHTSIYEIDLSNGRRRLLAASDLGADLLAPAIAGGRLYWTRAETHASVVTLPRGGGRVRTLVAGATMPSWRPDGKQIGFYYGDWRIADWAINWDAGVIPVDGRGVAAGPRASLIANYAEDFEPEWSPRGRWIAYHSHRSPNPIPYYGAPGSTDDIWLRRIGAPPRDGGDIRLTDFGFETGSPSWSRDGTRLVFVSYDRNGVPGQDLLWLVTIDTLTGKPLGHSRVPLPAGVKAVAWAAWSPLNDDIAIEGEGAAEGRHALWIMSPDSAHARQLVEFPMHTYGGVAWTPDGKTLVYSALEGVYDQLFAIDVAGGTPHRLTHEPAQMLHPRLSPNGRVIAASRLEHRKTIVSVPLPTPESATSVQRSRDGKP